MFHISEILFQIVSVTLQKMCLNLFFLVTEVSEEVVNLPCQKWVHQILMNSEILQFYETSLLI